MVVPRSELTRRIKRQEEEEVILEDREVHYNRYRQRSDGEVRSYALYSYFAIQRFQRGQKSYTKQL